MATTILPREDNRPKFMQDPEARKEVMRALRAMVDDQNTKIPEAKRAAVRDMLYKRNAIDRVTPDEVSQSMGFGRGAWPMTRAVAENFNEVSQNISPKFIAEHPFKTLGWATQPLMQLPAMVMDSANVLSHFIRPTAQSLMGHDPQLNFGEKMEKSLYRQSDLLDAGASVAHRAPYLFDKYQAEGMSPEDAAARIQREVTLQGLGGFAAESAGAVFDVPTAGQLVGKGINMFDAFRARQAAAKTPVVLPPTRRFQEPDELTKWMQRDEPRADASGQLYLPGMHEPQGGNLLPGEILARQEAAPPAASVLPWQEKQMTFADMIAEQNRPAPELTGRVHMFNAVPATKNEKIADSIKKMWQERRDRAMRQAFQPAPAPAAPEAPWVDPNALQIVDIKSPKGTSIEDVLPAVEPYKPAPLPDIIPGLQPNKPVKPKGTKGKKKITAPKAVDDVIEPELPVLGEERDLLAEAAARQEAPIAAPVNVPAVGGWTVRPMSKVTSGGKKVVTGYALMSPDGKLAQVFKTENEAAQALSAKGSPTSPVGGKIAPQPVGVGAATKAAGKPQKAKTRPDNSIVAPPSKKNAPANLLPPDLQEGSQYDLGNGRTGTYAGLSDDFERHVFTLDNGSKIEHGLESSALNKIVPATAPGQPGIKTGASNLKKAAQGIRVKKTGSSGGKLYSGDPISIAFQQVFGDLRVSITPEGRAAWEAFLRDDVPGIVDEARRTGANISDILQREYDSMSPEQLRIAGALASRHASMGAARKVHTLNVDRLNDESAAQAVLARADEDQALKEPPRRLTRNERLGSIDEEVIELSDKLARSGEKAAAAGDIPILRIRQLLQDVEEGRIPLDDTAKDVLSGYIADFTQLGTATARMLQARSRTYADLLEVRDTVRELLRAGRATADDVRIIDDILSEVGQLAPSKRGTFLRMLHEYGVNNILSAAMTGIRNIAGMTYGLTGMVASRATTGALNKLLFRPINKLAGKELITGTDVRMREVVPLVSGMLKGIPGGIKRGLRYLQHEYSNGVLRSFNADIDKVNRSNIDTAVKERKIAELTKERDEFITATASSQDRLRELALTQRRTIPGTVGKVVNTPARTLKATDESFTAAFQRGLTDALITRIATKRGIPRTEVVPSAKELKEVMEEADYWLFKTRAPKLIRGLAMAGSPDTVPVYLLANTAMFLKTNYNIMKNSADATILGPVIAGLSTESGRNLDALRRSDTWGKALAGTILTYAAYKQFHSKNGEIHGTAKNQQEREARAKVDLPSGPFVIYPNGEFLDFTNNYPAAFFVEGMAAWDNLKRMEKREKRPYSAGTKAGMFAGAMGNAALNMSAMSGVKRALDTVSRTGGWNPQDNPEEMSPLEQWLYENAASRLIPGSGAMNEVNRTFKDKTQRQPRNAGEVFKAKVPGLSQQVPAKVDIYGKQTEKAVPFTPFHGRQKLGGDAADKELLRLGIFPTDIVDKFGKLPADPEDRKQVKQALGGLLKSTVEQVISAPNYEQMSEAQKYKLVKEKIIARFKNAQNKMLKGKTYQRAASEGVLLDAIMRSEFDDRAVDAPRSEGVLPFLP